VRNLQNLEHKSQIVRSKSEIFRFHWEIRNSDTASHGNMKYLSNLACSSAPRTPKLTINIGFCLKQNQKNLKFNEKCKILSQIENFTEQIWFFSNFNNKSEIPTRRHMKIWNMWAISLALMQQRLLKLRWKSDFSAKSEKSEIVRTNTKSQNKFQKLWTKSEISNQNLKYRKIELRYRRKYRASSTFKTSIWSSPNLDIKAPFVAHFPESKCGKQISIVSQYRCFDLRFRHFTKPRYLVRF